MLLRDGDRVAGLSARVDEPQRLQMRIVKTLNAHSQAVHTGLAVSRKARRFYRTRIRFQRDFRVQVQRQQHAHLA